MPEGKKPAPAETETPADQRSFANLEAKLAYITGQMAGIEKAGYNKAQNYKFVRESDVAERASRLFADLGIFLVQTVLSHTMDPLYTTQSGLQMWLTTVEIQFYFIDSVTGEKTEPVMFPGTGADTGDKGLYKAMTGAEKYFLMKTFLVSTGDDPEADEKTDKAAAAAGAAQGTRVVRGSQAGVQRGGRSSLATTAQITEIARLAKERGLNAETIIPIITKVTGKSPTEGETMRQWLAGFAGAEAASVIEALSTVPEDAVETVDTGTEEVAAELQEVENTNFSVT